ncbi:MAG: lectin [Rhodanobacteraceae bacterium]
MQTGGTLPPRSVLDAAPDFKGIGPLRFGMTAEMMREKWGNPLYGGPDPGDQDTQACYYLRPRKDDYALLLMIEDGKFVRADVRKDSIIAPGGGRIGMTGDAMRKLYAGRIEAAPNKYDPSAQTLRVRPRHDEPARLVFEVDARGKVTSWRIGLPPQVDYVEGCS